MLKNLSDIFPIFLSENVNRKENNIFCDYLLLNIHSKVVSKALDLRKRVNKSLIIL